MRRHCFLELGLEGRVGSVLGEKNLLSRERGSRPFVGDLAEEIPSS